jgi:hypothetical protein
VNFTPLIDQNIPGSNTVFLLPLLPPFFPTHFNDLKFRQIFSRQ